MNDALRLGAIVAGSLLAARFVQHLWDRRRAHRLGTAVRSLGLDPVAGEEAMETLPFLAPLGGATIEHLWVGTLEGGETRLLAVRAGTGPALGYTLLARRAAAWSARVVVRPSGLRGAPPAGSPDPRLLERISTPELTGVLAGARAWLHIEGPWRAVGTPELASVRSVERLVVLLGRLPALVPEPDEFAGGLEWNV